MSGIDNADDKAEVIQLLNGLNTTQLSIIRSIIERFAGGFVGSLERKDFLSDDGFDYFGTRLAAHHAYSSKMLKKENFEHIVEQTFKREGVEVKPQVGMTFRGADLEVKGTRLSLKTEAARNLRPDLITISKLMEAAWIKQVTAKQDIPGFIAEKVMTHFNNYDRIFMLRSYVDTDRDGNIRYDLYEIPKKLLLRIGRLEAADFRDLTRTRTTSANVAVDGRRAFAFRLDGSDDKLTINHLDVSLCQLHAWWSLAAPI